MTFHQVMHFFHLEFSLLTILYIYISVEQNWCQKSWHTDCNGSGAQREWGFFFLIFN